MWIDLEMTGLDPQKDRILEVAAIATDWNFNEIAVFESPVKVDESLIAKRMVGDFWESNIESKNGLVNQNKLAEYDTKQVEQLLINFIKANFESELENNQPILLAGNSIHQDRRFIRHEWLELDKLLHYRMLDVSSWKVVMNGKYKRVFAKPEDHRALEDIRGSIQELEFYLKKVKK